jgi:hypothetical protein
VLRTRKTPLFKLVVSIAPQSLEFKPNVGDIQSVSGGRSPQRSHWAHVYVCVCVCYTSSWSICCSSMLHPPRAWSAFSS